MSDETTAPGGLSAPVDPWEVYSEITSFAAPGPAVMDLPRGQITIRLPGMWPTEPGEVLTPKMRRLAHLRERLALRIAPWIQDGDEW